jgi:ABC-type cobalt transport system substrate-binding protein
MKRVIYLIVVAVVALMLFVPTALAQEATKGEVKEKAQQKVQETTTKVEQTVQDLPKSGGAPVGSLLLPAGALLVGSGVMAYAVLRRRR